MMVLRPIIIDDNNVVQGGNMRLKAIQELGYKEIPESWVKKATDFTPEELKEFIIKDNVSFGDWDWTALNNDLFEEFQKDQLEAWGLDFVDLSAGNNIQGDFGDAGITVKNQYGVIVICKDAAEQETIFTELQARGLHCKIVVT